MMRGRISWAVIGLCLWAVASMAPKWAQAIPLNVDTDPVPYAGFVAADSKFVSGEVDILSISSDRIELQVFADQQGFGRFGVLAVVPDLSTKTPDGGGTLGITGDGINADVDFAFVFDDEAIFSFGHFPSVGKGVPKATDPFFVDYSGDPLAVGDMIFFRIFSGGGKGGDTLSVIVQTEIIPEPTTALLMGVGLGGLGLLGTLSARRRR